MSTKCASLYLSVQARRQLAQAARRLGKSQAELANVAPTRYLAKVKEPRFSFIGAGEDTVVSGRTSEAWLRKSRKRVRKVAVGKMMTRESDLRVPTDR
jgi:hypothetical protein